MTSQLIVQFLFAFFATCGLSIIFRVPVPKIPVCGLIGACGWLIYYIVTTYYGFSGVIACFCASCVVALLSDISSKVFKEAATIFIIPGIICLGSRCGNVQSHAGAAEQRYKRLHRGRHHNAACGRLHSRRASGDGLSSEDNQDDIQKASHCGKNDVGSAVFFVGRARSSCTSAAIPYKPCFLYKN